MGDLDLKFSGKLRNRCPNSYAKNGAFSRYRRKPEEGQKDLPTRAKVNPITQDLGTGPIATISTSFDSAYVIPTAVLKLVVMVDSFQRMRFHQPFLRV